MREWCLKTMAVIGASAPLLVLLMLSLVMAEARESEPRKGTPAPERTAHESANSAHPGALVEWLEHAAVTYQSDVARKLSVPRHAGMSADVDVPLQSAPGIVETLKSAVDGALSFIVFWIDQAYRVAGFPPTKLAYSSVALLADQTARDARAFVEARKKAEEDWQAAVDRANAAAAAALQQESARKSAAGRDAAEAERRRAEARKEELRKLKEDLDRRIEEGLKKLEQLEKLDATKKTETTRKALAADAARGVAEALKAAAEKRKAAAEKRVADAKAAYAREVAEAEEARKTAQAAQARKAEEERRTAEAKAKAVEEKRLAELKAEEARKAAAAEGARKAEIQAIEERRRAATEAEQARKAEDARKAAEGRKAAEEKRVADARIDGAAAKPSISATASTPETREAEIKAIEERRRAVAEETPPPADTAQTTAELKTADATKAASPRVIRRKKQVRAARPSAKKAHIAKSRRHAAKARYKRKKWARVRRARIHVVRRGETLSGIARRYLGHGARYRKIYRMNRRTLCSPHRILPGQRLRLP